MLHKEDKTEMKKKRALRILSLILLCALTFTACKKNVGTPEDNAASKDENTEEKDKDEQESWKIGFSGIDMGNQCNYFKSGGLGEDHPFAGSFKRS